MATSSSYGLVAVVGAGLSGLAAARTLRDAGHRVAVFDKGRGVGGRMSTRRHDALRFDHGAQYFTARDEAFRDEVDAWQRAGVAARWEGLIGTADGGRWRPSPDDAARWVGTPGMNAPVKHLARGLNVRVGTRVTAVRRESGAWRLSTDAGLLAGAFDALVVALPAEQAAGLLSDAAPETAARCDTVRMEPCWAVMAAFDERLPVDADGLFIGSGPLGWAARNASKPERPAAEAWVLHATPAWSRAHLDDAQDDVAAHLLTAFFAATGIGPRESVHAAAHRWRFARSGEPLDAGCLHDAGLRLAVCGDWCAGDRVEGAWRSGQAAAAALR